MEKIFKWTLYSLYFVVLCLMVFYLVGIIVDYYVDKAGLCQEEEVYLLTQVQDSAKISTSNITKVYISKYN